CPQKDKDNLGDQCHSSVESGLMNGLDTRPLDRVSTVKYLAFIRTTEFMDKHQRSILLSEEAQIVEQLAVIRTKLNALAPIAALPPEILLHILSLCAQRAPPTMRQHYCHIMAFTQVCRQWRSLPLQNSKLWTVIDLCDTAYAFAFLSRCKNAQIVIIAATPRGESLEGHKNRISSIDTILFPDDMLALFRSIDADDVIKLNNLTELGLQGVKVNWESCNGPQLFGMLERSPSLEKMELEDVVPADTEGYKPTYLSKMTVGSKNSDVVRAVQEGMIIPSDVGHSGYIDAGFSPDVLYSIAEYHNTRIILSGVASAT
ncbi:hypothetical protein MPER_03538, partial [Moniliophthora perniciosa FA553]